jgi:hypothetical protein
MNNGILDLIEAIPVGKILIIKAAFPKCPNLPSLIGKYTNESHHDGSSNNLKRPRMDTANTNKNPNNRAKDKDQNCCNKVNIRVAGHVESTEIRHEYPWVYYCREGEPCALLLVDWVYCWKLQLEWVVIRVQDQIVVRSEFRKVDDPHECHLHGQSHYQCEYCDLHVRVFYYLYRTYNYADAYNIVDDPVSARKGITHNEADSNKETDEIHDSDREEFLDLKPKLEYLKFE